MKFEMSADSNYMNFIMERVWRNAVLEFRTVLEIDPDDMGVVGWVTGIDEDTIQICELNRDYRIRFLNRSQIVDTAEFINTETGQVFKASDIQSLRDRRKVLSFTETLRNKAGQIKEEKLARRSEVAEYQ